MRVGRPLLPLLGLIGIFGAMTAAALAATTGWGSAVEVPGTAALNVGGQAAVAAVSCASAGNCAAVGTYKNGSGRARAFVVNENNGVWGAEIDVASGVGLTSISCSAPGSCTAGGSYRSHAAVVNQRHGVWGKPIKLSRLQIGKGGIDSIACTKPGFCVATGYGSSGVFVASERRGVWSKALNVSGLKALHAESGLGVVVDSISCPTARSCAAGGVYEDNSGIQAFVVSERNGVWGKAMKVPGTGRLNRGGLGQVNSISCARAGFCTAGGVYSDGTGRNQAFVVNEKHSVWGKAIEVPGSGALNLGDIGNPGAAVNSISCVTARSCAAAGSYTDASNHVQPFVVDERNGVWGTAIEVPGSAALNVGGYAEADTVYCAKPGSCAASGVYNDGSGDKAVQTFVVTETDGVWNDAVELPGSSALNLGGNDAVDALFCPTAGSCVAGGSYTDGDGHQQAFVTSP